MISNMIPPSLSSVENPAFKVCSVMDEEESHAHGEMTIGAVRQAKEMAGDFLAFRAPHRSTSCAGMVDECMQASSQRKPGVLFLDEAAAFSNEAVQALVRTLATCARTGAGCPLAVILNVTVPVVGVDVGVVEALSGKDLDAFIERRNNLVFALECAAIGSREGLLFFGAKG